MRTASPDVPMSGPLSNLKVVEMGTLIAGPYCARLLAEFGADVVKVETPGEGDPLRKWRRLHAPPAGGCGPGRRKRGDDPRGRPASQVAPPARGHVALVVCPGAKQEI